MHKIYFSCSVAYGFTELVINSPCLWGYIIRLMKDLYVNGFI
jgi:hypothetical protein